MCQPWDPGEHQQWVVDSYQTSGRELRNCEDWGVHFQWIWEIFWHNKLFISFISIVELQGTLHTLHQLFYKSVSFESFFWPPDSIFSYKENCKVSLELLKLLFRLTNLENIGRAVWSCMSWEWMRTIMECRPRILLIFAIVKLQSAEEPGSDSDTRNKNCQDKYFLENILLIVKCVNSNLYHILMEECNQWQNNFWFEWDSYSQFLMFKYILHNCFNFVQWHEN